MAATAVIFQKATRREPGAWAPLPTRAPPRAALGPARVPARSPHTIARPPRPAHRAETWEGRRPRRPGRHTRSHGPLTSDRARTWEGRRPRRPGLRQVPRPRGRGRPRSRWLRMPRRRKHPRSRWLRMPRRRRHARSRWLRMPRRRRHARSRSLRMPRGRGRPRCRFLARDFLSKDPSCESCWRLRRVLAAVTTTAQRCPARSAPWRFCRSRGGSPAPAGCIWSASSRSAASTRRP